MTGYTRREVTTTRVEYYVPAPAEGSGYAYWAPLRDAIYAIERALGDAARYDDAVRVEARDGEIALSYPKDSEAPVILSETEEG